MRASVALKRFEECTFATCFSDVDPDLERSATAAHMSTAVRG